MTLHEILLGMIEDKKDIADLENEVRRLEDQHGVETYAELLYILANIKIGPLQAPALWKSACQHLHTLSQI